MKVAIDAGPLTSGHKVRGVGFYTKNLIEALGKNVEAIDVRSANLTKYDLIHIPYFNPFLFSFPENISNYKFVVTIHDLIPLIYPKQYPPGIRGKLNFLRQKIILKKAKAAITDSETSKKDIVRFLGVPFEKIHVVRLAPGKHFRKLEITKRYGLPEHFVLYVGDVNYNKNIPNLIKACKIAKIALVIVGKQAKDIEKLDLGHPELSHLKGIDFSKTIRLGFISDEDLVAIYNLATVYCQPSFYEGFGLPVLQAIACGTPTVVAKTQALVELAEGAAVFVDPNDPNDIAKGFKKRIKSPKLPREYSWEKTAKETLEVYKKCLKK